MIQLRHHTVDLELRHTFRLARGGSDSRRILVVEIEHDGLIGRGEAAPIARYGQDAASAERAAIASISCASKPPVSTVTVTTGRSPSAAARATSHVVSSPPENATIIGSPPAATEVMRVLLRRPPWEAKSPAA